jgi:hypothetical protein
VELVDLLSSFTCGERSESRSGSRRIIVREAATVGGPVYPSFYANSIGSSGSKHRRQLGQNGFPIFRVLD